MSEKKENVNQFKGLHEEISKMKAEYDAKLKIYNKSDKELLKYKNAANKLSDQLKQKIDNFNKENDKLKEFSAKINKLWDESKQKSTDFAKKVEAAYLKADATMT